MVGRTDRAGDESDGAALTTNTRFGPQVRRRLARAALHARLRRGRLLGARDARADAASHARRDDDDGGERGGDASFATTVELGMLACDGYFLVVHPTTNPDATRDL